MNRDVFRRFCVFSLLCALFFAVNAQAKETDPEKLVVGFRFESAIGQRGNGPGQFLRPSGMALGPVGNLYVADTGNDRIQKFDGKGEYLSEVGAFGWDTGQFNQPTDVATGRSGLEIYVADSRNNRIQIFNPHFRFLGAVGGKDVEGPLLLGSLAGIAVSPDGELYVTDTDADRVVQISTYSITDRSFGGYGYGSGRIQAPLGLAVSEKGAVYVCDSRNDRVAVFDRFGNFKTALGEASLSEPAGVCIGPQQTLFVADTGHNRVLAFDLKTGKVAGSLGGPDPGNDTGQFRGPMDVVWGPGDVLYVLDSGNHRIQKFRVLILRR
ncbi:MAG: NHL repeat-containing protein [bacterium]|nr:NHL repeat-containing protein [bacterium]